MNTEILAYNKETNTIEAVHMYVIYKDSNRLLVQDCLGCVYNLDLIDNTCSCSSETLPCPHFTYYYEKIADQSFRLNICGICYHTNKHAETCCFYCKSLFHLDCMQQLTKLSAEACPNCKAHWKKTPRICTHCRIQSNPPYYLCLSCDDAIVCKECKDMNIHPSHPLVCSLGGYWSSGIFPCVEVLRRAMELETGACSACGEEAKDLNKMKCSHLIDSSCLEKKIYDKNFKCGVCNVNMFLCLELEDNRLDSPEKHSVISSPKRYISVAPTLPQASFYNIQSNRLISSRYLPSPPLIKHRYHTHKRPAAFKLESSKYEFESPYILINGLDPYSTKSNSTSILTPKIPKVRSMCKTPTLPNLDSETSRKEILNPVIRIQITQVNKSRSSRIIRDDSIQLLRRG